MKMCSKTFFLSRSSQPARVSPGTWFVVQVSSPVIKKNIAFHMKSFLITLCNTISIISLFLCLVHFLLAVLTKLFIVCFIKTLFLQNLRRQAFFLLPSPPNLGLFLHILHLPQSASLHPSHLPHLPLLLLALSILSFRPRARAPSRLVLCFTLRPTFTELGYDEHFKKFLTEDYSTLTATCN